MSVIQTIRAHGYPLRVDSEKPLTDSQKQYLASVYEEYGPDKMKILSEGREGEPPLRTVVAKKWKWTSMETGFFPGVNLFFGSLRDGAGGFYNRHANELFINSETFPKHPNSFYPLGARRTIKHELAHALDDYSVTRYCAFKLECGEASHNYANHLRLDSFPVSTKAFVDHLEVYYGLRREESAEIVASAMAFLSNPKRHEYWSDGGPKCGKFSINLEETNPFFLAVKNFLDHYPSIPGANPEEQYEEEGFWLPILRIKLK